MGKEQKYPEIEITEHGEAAYDKIDMQYGFPTSTNSIMRGEYGYLKPIKLVKIQLRPAAGARGKIRMFECHCNRCGGSCIANERALREGTKKSCGCLERDNRTKLHEDAKKDYTGWKIDMLTAKYRVDDPNDPNYGKWCFECECGNLYYNIPWAVINNKRIHPNTIASCGCMTSQLRSEGIIRGRNSHGMYESRLYSVHGQMLARCYNQNHPKYPIYGGRGIYVCDEWYTPNVEGNPGFKNFAKWSYDHGFYDQPKDTSRSEILSIDRIDNDGPYAPWNCRWVTIKVQENNKSTNRHIRYNGEVYTFAQFRELFGIKDQVYLHEYVNKGKSLNAMVYNFMHFNEPDKRVYYDKKTGMWRNKEGFIVLIPKYDIELLD